jgi:hypothetical protein
VELAFSTDQIRTQAPPRQRVTVATDGYEVECRPPNSEDLLELRRWPAEAAPSKLLMRCIERASHDGCAATVDELPPEVLRAVTGEIALADPQAEVKVAIECPECGHLWRMDFDITTYLWTELEDWAHRLLREVHALASAYGWSEREVLGMPARRRGIYLEMVGG